MLYMLVFAFQVRTAPKRIQNTPQVRTGPQKIQNTILSLSLAYLYEIWTPERSLRDLFFLFCFFLRGLHIGGIKSYPLQID